MSTFFVSPDGVLFVQTIISVFMGVMNEHALMAFLYILKDCFSSGDIAMNFSFKCNLRVQCIYKLQISKGVEYCMEPLSIN